MITELAVRPTLFRRHRGMLEESLATTVSVSSVAELEAEVRKAWLHLGDRPVSISFKHVGYDDRCGWDTYYVLVDGQCVGMSDGAFGTQETDDSGN
jgi:hypothetical protein